MSEIEKSQRKVPTMVFLDIDECEWKPRLKIRRTPAKCLEEARAEAATPLA